MKKYFLIWLSLIPIVSFADTADLVVTAEEIMRAVNPRIAND